MFKPLDDRVVIRPDEAESKTPGGIFLPDNAKQIPHRGVVLAVGPGLLLDNGNRAEMSVKPGDRVVYSMYSGHEIELDEGDARILSEREILAVVDG